MMALSSSAVWLLAGIDAALLIIIGAILFIYIRNKSRDTAGVSELVRTIKENEPAQLEVLRGALKEQYGQSDEEAAENAKKLTKVKKAFYKHLINVHLERDGEAFASLDGRLDELLTAYRTMMPVVAEEPAQPEPQAPAAESQGASQISAAEADDFRADLEEIKRQNNELRKELDATKRALDETVNEYVSAYSGGAEAGKERLESEMHKLQDKKTHDAQENAPADTPPPAAPQTAAIAEEPAGIAAQTPPPAPPLEEPGAQQTPPELAQSQQQGQSQDDIDQLMEDIPNLDGILVEEIDAGEDAAAASAPDNTHKVTEKQEQ